MSELEDKINAVLGDPKQMEQITKLAKSFMGGGAPGPAAQPEEKGEEDPFSSLGIDGATLQRLARLLRQGGAEKPQEQALLEAMRPYLSEKRRSKMDRAMKLARLAQIARLAMGEMGGDGGDQSLPR